MDACVVGAGAAGLWAARALARAGVRVVVLEKTARTGTKILASGGTRCNLTTTLPALDAANLFGPRGARFLRTAFRLLPPDAVRRAFDDLGVPTVSAPLEKIFPASGRARDVRDALERDARAAGAEIRLASPVAAIRPEGSGWRIEIDGSDSLLTSRVLLCPGGKSYPRTGTTGDGYGWLRALDLTVIDPVPALVPLTTPEPNIRALTGISVPDAEARLVDRDRRIVSRRRRPVLFTHRGVSGPGAMDLSEPVARGSAAPYELRLDLLPETSAERLRARFDSATGRERVPSLDAWLPQHLPRRLRVVVARQAGDLDPRRRIGEIPRAKRHALVETLKGLRIPIDGTEGWDRAEVTAGGLALDEVDAGSMRVKRHAGLHVFGEILDLTGPIGGLNFQAAFSTAELAARAISGT